MNLQVWRAKVTASLQAASGNVLPVDASPDTGLYPGASQFRHPPKLAWGAKHFTIALGRTGRPSPCPGHMLQHGPASILAPTPHKMSMNSNWCARWESNPLYTCPSRSSGAQPLSLPSLSASPTADLSLSLNWSLCTRPTALCRPAYEAVFRDAGSSGAYRRTYTIGHPHGNLRAKTTLSELG